MEESNAKTMTIQIEGMGYSIGMTELKLIYEAYT